MFRGSGFIQQRINAWCTIFRCSDFNAIPAYRTTIRKCSVIKEPFQQQRDVSRFVHRKSGVNNQLALSEESQAKIISFFAHHPLTENERNGRVFIGVDGDKADQIAVGEGKSTSTESIIDRQTLIPKPPAYDSPYRETRECLPIFEHRQTILNLINANQVIVLSGATGTDYIIYSIISMI